MGPSGISALLRLRVQNRCGLGAFLRGHVLVGDGGRMHTDGPAGADEIHTLYGICWKIPRVVPLARYTQF
jgi:hypothetical protein